MSHLGREYGRVVEELGEEEAQRSQLLANADLLGHDNDAAYSEG